MSMHQINWPTDITRDLITRLRKRSMEVDLEVSIATEIYELGRDFEIVLLKKIHPDPWSHPERGPQQDFSTGYEDTASIISFLHCTEAYGYLRVGYEILYFSQNL